MCVCVCVCVCVAVLGHNFNAAHTFGSGGLMDYGDSKVNGIYQFSDLNKNEVYVHVPLRHRTVWSSICSCVCVFVSVCDMWADART